METLKKNGVKVITSAKETADQYKTAGKKARQMLVGKVYSAELLSKVEQTLQEYRAKGKGVVK